ncbi:RDD family protein [Natrononativus amylolyticus]|uniref:RDD family protein n=1 Tax=Natrononativus amylolyticus TaxID=2963434 RepID=UPI0020CB835E|nr:RDD family protein [Natrononativus amylolyticus]
MDKHPAPRKGTEGDAVLKRFVAFILDSIILMVISVAIILPGALIGETVAALFALVAVVVSLVYVFLLEGLYGYTPGKYAMGLVVVKSDGSPCTVGSSVIRNLLLIVDQLPFMYLIGIVLMFVTDRSQRVGDLAADTVVVERA